MVSVTCVLSQFSSPSANQTSVIPSLTSILKMTERIIHTIQNFISEATSIIKQVSTIYLNTKFLTSNLVIRIEKISGLKLLDFQSNLLHLLQSKNIFKSIFPFKVSLEGDFLSCLHQLFETEESEIYGDYLQLRELVEIDEKFIDRSGLVIDGEGKI